MKKTNNYIGTHLILDVTVNDPEILKDTGVSSKYLSQIIDLCEMSCLLPPQVFSFPYSSEYCKFLDKLEEEGTTSPLIKEAMDRYNYNKTEGSGNTGIACLAESHTSMHTFPEKNFISIDVYSCKHFDTDKVSEFTAKYWGAKSMNTIEVTRYIDSPQTVKQFTKEYEI